VLASTSRYRRELLGRLRLPFEVAAPDADEAPLTQEAPQATALRLAQAKARMVAPAFPDALIIGCDQVADLDGSCLGKPGNHGKAIAQLRAMRGTDVVFHTALALLNLAIFVASLVIEGFLFMVAMRLALWQSALLVAVDVVLSQAVIWPVSDWLAGLQAP
jgi:septum formation protein